MSVRSDAARSLLRQTTNRREPSFCCQRLNGEPPIKAEDVGVTPHELYECSSAPAAAGLENHTCETTDDSPHTNTVRGHLTDPFDLDAVEQVSNTLLQRDVLDTLPDRPVEIVADLHLDPYYRDEDETEDLYFSEARAGTTAFHAYGALRTRAERAALAVRRLEAGETTSDVLAAFLHLLDGLDPRVKTVYLDRGFYTSDCLGPLYAHNYAYPCRSSSGAGQSKPNSYSRL